MRRDLVVQVIVQYDDFWENFATPFEAESFINSNLDELDLPVMVRLEDMKGNVKWYYDLVEDEGGVYRLVDRDCESTDACASRILSMSIYADQLKKKRQAGLSVSSQ